MFRMTNKNRKLFAGIIGGVLALVMVLGALAPLIMSMM